jgi:murein DD-endopeptidase MepM/ murein hydrolase activator NlpD
MTHRTPITVCGILGLSLGLSLVTPTVASAAITATPSTLTTTQATTQTTTQTPAEPTAADAALARLGQLLDLPLIPRGLLESWVRWQFGIRDLVRNASAGLDALAGEASALTARVAVVPGAAPNAPSVPSPASFDLTILATSPIAAMSPDESSGFGWRDDPMRHDRRFHYGTDFRSKPGTPVLAAGAGIVVFCGRQGGYGNVIYVDHGGGVLTRYGHLRKIETQKGAAVAAGAEIGQVGSTGRSTGPHLHFEVRLDGRAVNPVLAMQVADLERDQPSAGRLAAMALSPEIQKLSRDTHDRPRADRSADRTERRPERAGRGKRTQTLW